MRAFESSNDCRGNVRVLEQRAAMLKVANWLCGCALVATIAYGALAGYRTWRERHLEAQAQEFAARHDVANAVLVARRVLTLNPTNLGALRVMSEMAESNGSADAIEWRKAVATAQPENVQNHFALAQTALRFGRGLLAERALEKVTGQARETSRFHQLAGATALNQNQNARAEEHFAIAHQLEPSDHQAAVNLAVLRLASPDKRTSESARAELQNLAQLTDTRAAALRALTAEALARGDRAAAAPLSVQLVGVSANSLADRLLALEAALGTDAGPDALRHAQDLAATSPSAVAELIVWMNRHELSQPALAWTRSLPQAIVETQSVALATAEALSCTRDWPALAQFVAGKNWGTQEPLRLAIEGHARQHLSGENSQSPDAGALWREALKAAANRPEQLLALAQLEAGWGYNAQAEEAWWTVANSGAMPLGALTALQKFYTKTGDSRGLLRVAKRALELNPNDFVAANNCASLGLLLQSDNSSRRLASKLYFEHPHNPALAATYAFALFSEGKTADALKLITTLDEAQLRDPGVAAYYVVMLVANGENERALAFLPAAKQANLLPEERQLLAEATHKLLGKAIAASAAKS